MLIFRIRELCQIMDSAIMIHHSLDFRQELLALSGLFLVVGVNLEFFSIPKITEFYQKNGFRIYIGKKENVENFNSLMDHFLTSRLNMSLRNIIPCLKFVSQLYMTNFDTSVPEEYENDEYQVFPEI